MAVEADRVDVAHPAARKWLQGRGGSGVAELPTDVRFVPFELFAKLAEVEVPAVPVGFCDDNDRIDLSAPAVLEWLAARPFGRSGYRKGEVQAGELFVPGEWYSIRRRELDGSYRLRGVLMRAYLARLVGAVPTSADVKAFERAQRDFSFEFDDRIRTA